MNELAYRVTETAWAAVSGATVETDNVVFTGSGSLPSTFPVTDLASASIAAAGLGVAELVYQAHGQRPLVSVDRRLSSLWFQTSLRPVGWTLPSPWDPIAGDYRTRDGWIRLHTNAPHHRTAAEQVLGASNDRAAVATAVARWGKTKLETAVVQEGGCAAEMRSLAEWQEHPQGRAIAKEPLAHLSSTGRGAPPNWRVPIERPLEGVRVLDLTRVLAGPVATRFLAGYGATVLRIDPPDWDEPGVVPEVTLGKRCARLNLREAGDRARFEALLSQADVLLHGYRSDALEGLGLGLNLRRRLAPGLVDVCLDAYGWSGPWITRRGFDSLVQMSAGIADAGMRWRGADKPVPLPVQALDHATGYLMAAAAICGLARRLTDGIGIAARFSLARTAKLLVDQKRNGESHELAPESASDRSPVVEVTQWGDARRIAAPLQIAGAPMRWDIPARALGSALPDWSDR